MRNCPHAPTWEGVEKCLRKQGTPTVIKTLPSARLVHLEQHQDQTTYDGGVYLYIQRGNQWTLGGMYENRGSDYEVLGLEPVTAGKHVGYRIDIGQQLRTSVQPDGVTNVPALISVRGVLLCGGDTWSCTEVTTACDVLVRGAALWSFRGKLTVGNNEVRVAGDRSHLGPWCNAVEQQLLGWTQ